MTTADLESLRREYAAYRNMLGDEIQTKLRPTSKTTKQLTACNGVLSVVQTALDALKGVQKGITVADFEESHPNYDLARPIARNLKRWRKLRGSVNYSRMPILP